MAQVVGSNRKRQQEAILVYAVLAVLGLAFVFPLIWVLGLSLKTRLQIFATPPLYLWWPTLENYADILTRADFAQAFINTLIVSASAVLLSLCVGVPAAYAFARFPFTGRTFLFFALLVMRMLPPIAVLVPMYVLFSKLGLATTRFSVVLADTTFALPLVVWLMRGFFEDLPTELEESAWIDGASRYRAFWHIVLPLARPGLVAASILCLQLAWNDFLFPAVLTNNATQTLPVMMAAFNAGDSGVDWGGLTASGILVILPVIVFSFIAQNTLSPGFRRAQLKAEANEQQSKGEERQWPESTDATCYSDPRRRAACSRPRHVGRGRRTSRRSSFISARTRAAGSEPWWRRSGRPSRKPPGSKCSSHSSRWMRGMRG